MKRFIVLLSISTLAFALMGCQNPQTQNADDADNSVSGSSTATVVVEGSSENSNSSTGTLNIVNEGEDASTASASGSLTIVEGTTEETTE